MQNVITVAISSRTLLSFRHDGRLCVVEPHLLGFLDGVLCMHAWQTNGRKPGWQKFKLSDISRLTVLEGTFERVRPGHNASLPNWQPLCSAAVGIHHAA